VRFSSENDMDLQYTISDFQNMGVIRVIGGGAAKLPHGWSLQRFQNNFSDCPVAFRMDKDILLK
jgi:hypothetical protein